MQGRGELKGFKLPALAKKPIEAADLLYAYDSAGLLLWGLACDGGLEQAAEHVLHLGGPLEEELGRRRDQLEAHRLARG